MKLIFKSILLSGAILGACLQSSHAGRIEEFSDSEEDKARASRIKDANVEFKNNTNDQIKINFTVFRGGQPEGIAVRDAVVNPKCRLVYIWEGVPMMLESYLISSFHEETTDTYYTHGSNNKDLTQVWFETFGPTHLVTDGILSFHLKASKS